MSVTTSNEPNRREEKDELEEEEHNNDVEQTSTTRSSTSTTNSTTPVDINNDNNGGGLDGSTTSSNIDCSSSEHNDSNEDHRKHNKDDDRIHRHHHTDCKHHVRFSSIEWKEYTRTVGINPSCQNGPALELGDWIPQSTHEPISIDKYELEYCHGHHRQSDSNIEEANPSSFCSSQQYQHMDFPQLSGMERESLLLQSGLTSEEIWKVTNAKDLYIKKQCRHNRRWSTSALAQALHLIPSNSPFNKHRMTKAHKQRIEILNQINNHRHDDNGEKSGTNDQEGPPLSVQSQTF